MGFYPVVPLAQGQALGIAIMSYDGRLGFGLLGDYDALADLDDLADDLAAAVTALEGAAGSGPSTPAKDARTPAATGADGSRATPRRAARRAPAPT